MSLENHIKICSEKVINFFRSIRGKLIGCFLLMIMIPLLTVSIISYYNGRKAVEQRVIEQLTSIADLKKAELQGWLKERLLDARIISGNKFLQAAFTSLLYIRRSMDSVESMLKSDIGKEYYTRLLVYLNKLKSNYKVYDEIYITDIANGEIIISTNEDNVGKIENDILFYTDVLKMKGLPVNDIHYSNYTNQICMTFFGPIQKTDPVTLLGSNIMVGALLLRVNTEDSIEPMIQNWPGMGETGETLLVRREDKNVMFLNNLRHLKESALKFSVPMASKIAQPSILSLEAKEGIIETTDYRNVSVLSAYRYLPMPKWGLVAKQDSDEAFAPINKLKRQIIDSNKKAEELSGYSKFELSELKIWDMYCVQDSQRLEKLWEQVKESGSGTLHDINYKRKDGSIVPISLSASVIEYGNRKFIQIICRDITERKRMEQQLIRTERLAAIGELAAEVAHEVNNPLGGLHNFAKMIEKEPENIQQTKEFITLIQEGLKRIEIIVKRLTTFSKPYVLKMSNYNLNDIIKSSLLFKEHRMEVGNISLQKRFEPNLPKVYVDVDNISQVIINLLANAFDSMPNGGKLLIESQVCKEHNFCVQLAISDTGEGIKKEEADKIFDPFFTTKGKGKGIGIGLATSKRIIEDHGGNIMVTSSLGEGATFTVCLPVRNNEERL